MSNVEYLKNLKVNASTELCRIDWVEAFFDFLKAEGKFEDLEYKLLRLDFDKLRKECFVPIRYVKLGQTEKFLEQFSKFIFKKYHVTTSDKLILVYLKNGLENVCLEKSFIKEMKLIEDNGYTLLSVALQIY